MPIVPEQNPLKRIDVQTKLTFDGNTYEPELDQQRLTTSYQKIFNFMSDGAWHKLKTLAFVGDCSEAGASARIRDFRKERNGSHTVNSKRLSGGTWVYQLIRNNYDPLCYHDCPQCNYRCNCDRQPCNCCKN